MQSLIIIPTYNEIENIEEILSVVLGMNELSNVNVLIVDDNSPDKTGDRVQGLIDNNLYSGRLHLIRRSGKLGLGTAYITGFQWGLERGYEVLVEMDADFSHNPKYLVPIFKQLEDYDFIVGSRYVDGGGVENWGILRQFISRFGSFYARTILGIPMRDLTGGFNFWKRHVLEEIGLERVQSSGYAFQVELKYRAWRKKFSFKEFPIVFADRCKGASKMSQKIVFEAMYRVWKIRGVK